MDIVNATRTPGEYGLKELEGLISYGGSSSAFSYYQEESFVNAEGRIIQVKKDYPAFHAVLTELAEQ